MKYNQYITTLKRHLRVDRKTKKRIIKSLYEEVQFSLDNGENIDDILNRMGSADRMAKDYNESYKEDPIYQKHRKYIIIRRIAIVSLLTAVVLLLVSVSVQFYILNSSFVSQVGGVSEPNSVETTSQTVGIIHLLKNTNKIVPFALIVFVLSTIYCIITRIKKKKVDDDEKN